MQSRLEGTVASGSRHESDKTELKELLLQIDCINPEKWPSGVDSPWCDGERRFELLCKRLKIPFTTSLLTDFRDFIDNPNTTPRSVTFIHSVVNTLPVSSSDCERGFSSMNNVCTDLRNKLTTMHVSELVFLSLVGPPLSQFNPQPYVTAWLKHHRSADDTRTRKAVCPSDERYQRLWSVFS